jgi:hypothetical protein
MKYALTALLAALAFFVFASMEFHRRKETLNAQAEIHHRIDFDKISPKEFVKILRLPGKVNGDYLEFLDRAPLNWVTEADVKFLMPLLRSTDSCKCLLSPLSSTLYHAGSATMGGYAAELIDSYRNKSRFPQSFFSCPSTSAEKINAIWEWQLHH